MSFQEKWERAIVGRIATAIHVPTDNKQSVHINRAYHGLVLNDPDCIRDYIFSDGRVMRTEGRELFYLPKGSSYSVKEVVTGGGSCYAINFDADIDCEPFVLSFRNSDQLFKLFKEADLLWKSQTSFSEMSIRRILYEIIVLVGKEYEKKYTPKRFEKILEPAIEKIKASFTDNSLDVSELASLTGVSEAYFRRLFLNKFGVTPKEYIIDLRLNYAKSLLATGEFSVSRVALMCGYSEPTHFSREFSRRVGVAPKDYRG